MVARRMEACTLLKVLNLSSRTTKTTMPLGKKTLSVLVFSLNDDNVAVFSGFLQRLTQVLANL